MYRCVCAYLRAHAIDFQFLQKRKGSSGSSNDRKLLAINQSRFASYIIHANMYMYVVRDQNNDKKMGEIKALCLRKQMMKGKAKGGWLFAWMDAMDAYFSMSLSICSYELWCLHSTHKRSMDFNVCMCLCVGCSIYKHAKGHMDWKLQQKKWVPLPPSPPSTVAACCCCCYSVHSFWYLCL